MIQFSKSEFAFSFLLAVTWLTCNALAQDAAKLTTHELRLNHIQVIGTHNSYHLAPEPKLLGLIAAASQPAALSIDYSHAPIEIQLANFGIRQFELDVYADPQGGLFSNPVGKSLLESNESDPRMQFDFPSAMSKPGMKIIHSPGFDFATTVPTLKEALLQIRNWSESNPQHVPILVMIELKEDVTGPAGVKPRTFDSDLLNALDSEIRSIVPAVGMLTPDDVRGEFTTLLAAVLERGWPKLDDCRGKLLFALDNEGAVCDRYLEGHPILNDRVMFASVSESHPAAAWMKINDPIREFEKIQTMVAKGFLVRTRADVETKQSRTNDTTQREKAFASGAQFVSTDYPRADPRFSEYSVQFENGSMVRINPTSRPSLVDLARTQLEPHN
ncbi:MAG: phosphatidylinositol-specific phospholipase C1-like protein [Planctomycetota bacterium]|nr:phosphatidylinositol-specific phospholipase C1-like protein [Planctomycetota bacterium]